MADRNSEVVTAQLVDRLKKLGLTEYESLTLIILTRLGTATAKDVARTNDVPRTRVYDAVETLHERGLVDVQHTTPRKFTVVSMETVIRKLDVDRQNTITEIGELFEELTPVEPQREEAGVWTVTGHEAVAQRVFEFLDEAEDQIIYMTIDELLNDQHLEHLREAEDRSVTIYLAGMSAAVEGRIQETIPSAKLFDTLWDWEDTPAGSLLVVDEQTALVSVRIDDSDTTEIEETAIWGSGERNSLVVVLRAIFTWRLGDNDSSV